GFIHAAGPATVKEAAAMINLETLPLAPDAQAPGSQTIAELNYQAKGSVPAVYKFHQQQLTKSGWKELPGGYATEQAASGTFSRADYSLSVTVFQSGDSAQVSIINHGNVPLAKLPVPPGAKVLYAGPASLMLVTTTPVDKTVSELTALLVKQGWTPFGSAGPQYFFKQNAVRLGVMVSAAPAQGGQTSINLSSSMMSADLPVPSEVEDLRYAEVTRTVDFLTSLSEEDLQKFYRSKLAEQGWQATTERPIESDFRKETFFVNPAKELLTLETRATDGKLRTSLKLETAAQVAELNKRAKAAAEKAKAAMEKPANKVTISIPSGIDKESSSAKRIELKAKTGDGKQISEEIRKSLEADGWKSKSTIDLKETGTIEFEKEGQKLLLLYVDPGFIPAEITLTGIGVELEAKAR
ncbi:MAG TPA: hypothetical protein VNQ76_18230, partial [Planctomicrobium sp.]|nr:hypothetical protein [Planctomicrobium sp.]